MAILLSPAIRPVRCGVEEILVVISKSPKALQMSGNSLRCILMHRRPPNHHCNSLPLLCNGLGTSLMRHRLWSGQHDFYLCNLVSPCQTGCRSSVCGSKTYLFCSRSYRPMVRDFPELRGDVGEYLAIPTTLKSQSVSQPLTVSVLSSGSCRRKWLLPLLTSISRRN